MEFKVDLVRPRERRAVLLIGAALAAIVAVSTTFLRPAGPAATAAPIVVKATVTYTAPRRVIILNPGTDVYFTWRAVVPGGFGGHRPG